MIISYKIKVEYEEPILIKLNAKILSEYFKNEEYELLKINLVSKVDLLKYFHDYERNIQPRCEIYVDSDRPKFDSIVFGPFYNTIDISDASKQYKKLKPNLKNGRFKYVLYALRNLEVMSIEDTNNKVVLKEIEFEKIQCYIVGVTKAPVVFPRTNFLTITYDEFYEIIKK